MRWSGEGQGHDAFLSQRQCSCRCAVGLSRDGTLGERVGVGVGMGPLAARDCEGMHGRVAGA